MIDIDKLKQAALAASSGYHVTERLAAHANLQNMLDPVAVLELIERLEAAEKAAPEKNEAKLREQAPVAWQFVDDEEAGYIAYQSKPPTQETIDYLAKWDRPAWQPLFLHPAPIPEGLTVKLSKMEESNGKVTWSVFLAKSGDEKPWDWCQVYSDSIKGRAEYEADSLKHFLGLGPKPDITAYDSDPQSPMAAARSKE